MKIVNLKYYCILFFFVLIAPLSLNAQESRLSEGETVYVSIYSNAYLGPKKTMVSLSTILSIRNIDQTNNIKVEKVGYYNSKGKFIASYIEKPFILNPLESTNFYIKEYDLRGGSGAKFIVKWSSDKKTNQPLIEGLMLGKGISFICRGINIIN